MDDMKMDNTWHQDDEFWQTMATMMFSEDRWESALEEVNALITLLDLTRKAKILDMGCGPGRHALELARHGFSVTGVDRTILYLNQAKQKVEQEGLEVEFVQADMRSFRRESSFDVALSLFTTFGYFEDPEENIKVLENLFRSLKEGGKLLMEMMGKESMARIFRQRDWREYNGIIHLEERMVTSDWSRMKNRWIKIEEGMRHEFKVTHWIYSAAELREMLKGVGFQVVNIFGGLEGSPYDHKARRLVAVAMKE
jgi:SAM-dependent methyltransferase